MYESKIKRFIMVRKLIQIPFKSKDIYSELTMVIVLILGYLDHNIWSHKMLFKSKLNKLSLQKEHSLGIFNLDFIQD